MSKHLPVAVQVYGLRDLLENTPQNFKSVMQQVKDLGYDGVELAGTYGLEPKFIKDTLAEIGLVPISAHVAFDEMMKNLDQVIADYSAIGVKFLVKIPETRRVLALMEAVRESARTGSSIPFEI